MAKFIEYRTIKKGSYEMIAKYGYFVIPVYGKQKINESTKKWIEDNVNGCWTTFSFAIPKHGQSYCFLEELDAMAFKLRWV